MRSISKADKLAHAQIADALAVARGAAQEAADVYNGVIVDGLNSRATIEAAHAKLVEAIGAYNASLETARDFIGCVVGEMDDYISDRADGWDEKPSGEQFVCWRDAWESASPDDVDDPEPLPAVSEDEDRDPYETYDTGYLCDAETFEDLPFNKAEA